MSILVSDTDSAFYLLDVLVEHAKDQGLRDGASRALHAKAETCYMLGRIQEGIGYFYEAIEFNEDAENLSRLYIRLGSCYRELGIQDLSLIHI